MDDEFYPCNNRERDILARLPAHQLATYKAARHGGATVTEALAEAEPRCCACGLAWPCPSPGGSHMSVDEVRARIAAN